MHVSPTELKECASGCNPTFANWCENESLGNARCWLPSKRKRRARDVSPRTQSFPLTLIWLSGLGRNVFNWWWVISDPSSLLQPSSVSSSLLPPLLRGVEEIKFCETSKSFPIHYPLHLGLHFPSSLAREARRILGAEIPLERNSGSEGCN